MTSSIQPGRYRHFKGGEYEVIELALHSETELPHVVYRPLYGEARWWIRPLDLFTDHKLIDGRKVARFERIGDRPERTGSLQEQVSDFCEQHGITAPIEARLLDLCSELGELAKLQLKATDYGRNTAAQPNPEAWQSELGDCLFALLCLANASGVDTGLVLDQTLQRYKQRIAAAGHPGSDAAG